MPRRNLERICAPAVPDVSPLENKKRILELCDWKESEIAKFLEESTLPAEKKTPSIAFFSILIRRIEESAKQLKHELPRLIKILGLCPPENVSSFVRFIRRHEEKAFTKQNFSGLSFVPSVLHDERLLVTVGPLCESIGITAEWLLHSKDTCHGNVQKMTQGMILELISFKRLKDVSDTQCAEWVQRLFHMNTVPYSGTIRLQWERIATRAYELRGKISERQVFLNRQYLPPSVRPATPCSPASKCKDSIKDTITSVVKEGAIVKDIDTRIKEAQAQFTCLQNEVLKQTEKLDKIKKTVGHFDTKNVQKRDRRATRNRKELNDCLEEIERLKKDLTNALKLKSKFQAKTVAEKCLPCGIKNSQISELTQKIQSLEFEEDPSSDDMRELTQQSKAMSSSGPHKLSTQEVKGGRVVYNDSIRLLYMQLLSLGVSVAKCSQVVKTVLEGLTDLEVDKLPAKSTTSSFQTDCESLAQMHVADVLLHRKDATLSLDGTKKKFREYGSFQISINENSEGKKRSMSMGIQEMLKGDADSFLDTLSDIFVDLAECFSDDEKEIKEMQADLTSRVKNLMTDRHVVNKTFSVKFEKYRKELFEKHLNDFDSLSENEQMKLVELNSLFCGLHVLSNMGTKAGQALKTYEDISLPPNAKITNHDLNKGNARTFDLVFEISQTMTVSGSQRFGRLAEWDAHLNDSGTKNRIISFLRHRFNVLFVDGAAIYFHRKDIETFLGTLVTTNKILLCIQESIKSPVCIAGLRALGIIAVLITQPLWKVIERQNIHVFDLNEHWLHLETSLRDLSTDATSLLQGNGVFPGFAADQDEVYHSLFEPVQPEIDSLTKECLELLCFQIHTLVKRQCEDQLPGGKFSTSALNDELLEATRSCPTTNRAGEKDFSDLDREVNRAPQRTTNHISAVICYRNNRTYEYFRSLPQEKRSKLMLRAMKLAPLKRKRNRDRAKQIKVNRKRLLMEAKAAHERKVERNLKAKADLRKRVEQGGGVWLTSQEIKERLAKLSKKDKKPALKDQLRFHQWFSPLVMQNMTTKGKTKEKKERAQTFQKLTKFSCNRAQLSVEQLSENLTTLVNLVSAGEDSVPNTGDDIGPTAVLRPQEERCRLLADHFEDVGAGLKKKTTAKPVKTTTNNLVKKASKAILKKAISRKRSSTTPVTDHSDSKKSKFQYKFNDSAAVDSFLAIAYEQNWYLSQVIRTITSDTAEVFFLERVGRNFFKIPEADRRKVETVDSIFVLDTGLLSIAPRDSSMRIWTLSPSPPVIDQIHMEYKKTYFNP